MPFRLAILVPLTQGKDNKIPPNRIKDIILYRDTAAGSAGRAPRKPAEREPLLTRDPQGAKSSEVTKDQWCIRVDDYRESLSWRSEYGQAAHS
jgi:hypothetical protein